MPPHFRPPFPVLGLAFLLAGPSAARALTYHISYLEDEGKRAQITAVMDQAVAVYNATTDINIDVNVIYHSGIPTAQANYNGELGFGGSISTQVAIHEIAHYLGSGTFGNWGGNFDGGGVWVGPSLRRYIKLFDGPGAEIRKSGVHYYPYGFNFGNEDSPVARYRIGRIIQAMRQDMGITNGDGDGISDEWERAKIGTAAQPGGADADGDGISNYDEWWTDSHPGRPGPVRHGHVYQLRSRLSQKLLEVENATRGANVRQNPNSGSDLQKWLATFIGAGYWKFTNLASGKALEVASFSTAAGGNIIVWDDLGNPNQQWRVFTTGGSYAKIGNRNSTNMIVDVEGGPAATGDNTNISQFFDDPNAFNQEWAFDDVTPGVFPTELRANYKLDGTARDHSGQGFHGLASGGVSFTTGRVDQRAATFNGVNGSIRIPAAIESRISIACWVKTTATAGTGQWYNGMGLVDGEVGGVAKDFGLAMVGNKAAFGVGQNDITMLSTTAINDGSWHHLAATLDTATGAMKLYLDGTLNVSGNAPAGARTAPVSLRLGSISGNRGYFNGSLDEVRLYKGLLSQTQITALATIGETVLARYPFDGDSDDAGLFGNHGSALRTTTVAGRIGSAVQFSASAGGGNGSLVTIPASVTGNFTVAYWVKTTATGGTGQWFNGQAMVDAELAGATEDWGLALVGNKAGFGIGNPDKTILSTTAINDGSWHHIAATREAGGAMKLYLDGDLEASDNGPTPDRNAPGSIRLGTSLNGGAFFTGAIDELHLFNHTLNAGEIAALAHPYTPAEQWRLDHFGITANTGLAADDFDADKDGLANLIERLYGTDPNAPNVSPVPTGEVMTAAELGLPGDTTYLTYRARVIRDRPDLTLRPQGAATLSELNGPEASTHALQAGPPTPDGDFEIFVWYYDVAIEDSADGNAFLRLSVE